MSDPVLDKVVSVLELREGGNVTEFCRKLGIVTSYYYGWIKRGRPPKTATLRKIADAYGIPLEWFYSGAAELPARSPVVPSATVAIPADVLALLQSQHDVIKSQQDTIRTLAEKIP